MVQVRRSPVPGQKIADPDIMLGADGRLYVASSAIPLADRAGRRVVRCLSLTPREEEELRRRIADLSGDVLVGVTAKRGGAR